MFKKITKIVRWFLKFRVVRRPTYAIFILIEKTTGYKIEKFFFNKYAGYKPNLKSPRSLNEYIVYKKIHNRDSLLTLTADKYQVREYVKDTLGDVKADEILVPLLYVTDDPETIPFDELPNEYIIKANHGSGTNIIVESGDVVDQERITRQCKKWLNWPYGLFKHEWAYRDIERKIVIEKLLRNKEGHLPGDYKLHMINGECVFIQVDLERHKESGIKRTIYTKDWNRLDVYIKYMEDGYDIERPDELSEMIKISEKLSLPFNHARIDLYYVDEKIYFGEITHYPGSGRAKIEPQSFDFYLGKKLS